MPTLYTENSEKWRSLASIDYFTQFVKAWIPFNAWYKNYYPECQTDKRALDEIKSTRNRFRNKLTSLLRSPSIDGAAFRLHVAELHLRLEDKPIFNRGEQINFIRISIERNPETNSNFERNRCRYTAVRGIPHRSGEVDVNIYKQNGSVGFSYTQTNGFDVTDLLNNQDFKKLSQRINPSKPVCLISYEQGNGIEMGSVYFINDVEVLSKGIIEILYKLRNVLFHGEVIPDGEANKVYEPAYHILYTLIQSL